MDPRRVDPWSSAVTALAGPCVELRHRTLRLGSSGAHPTMLDFWLRAAESNEEGDHDVLHTHGYLSAALPFVHALVADNATLILDVGAAILRPDPLSYDAAVAALGDRRPILTAPSVERAVAPFEPFADRMRAIDAAVAASK